MSAAGKLGVEISKETLSEASEEWPKWKIGLAVGAPIALVLGGIWLYRRKGGKGGKGKSDARNNTGAKSESRSLDETLSPTKDTPDGVFKG